MKIESSVKIYCLFLLMMLFGLIVIADSGEAGTYKGLEPGVSKKKDVDRVFGNPEKEIIRRQRYDYKPGNDDTRRISVQFSKEDGLIESIDIYPRDQYLKDSYQEWFELKEPDKKAKDNRGNLVEYYMSEGIALHFAGPDDSSHIEFLSYLAPDTIIVDHFEQDISEEEKYYIRESNIAVEKKDWKQAIDIIEEGLRKYPNNPRLWRNRSHYFFHVKNGSNEALRSAEKAYELEPSTEHALSLGWIHLEIFRNYAAALPFFEKAEEEFASKNPDLYYWMARCYEEVRNLTKASDYYNQFISVTPNSKRAEDARSRLSALMSNANTGQHEEVLFEDNFDTENKGKGTLNYRNFSKWNVIEGSVDLIGRKFWDFFPDHGLFVDLDGSTQNAGIIESKFFIDLAPGSYMLEFEIAGNPKQGPNTVTVRLGNVYVETFTLETIEPLMKRSRKIDVSNFNSAKLSFEHDGGDNFGVILDNVKLTRFGPTSVDR